MKRKIFWLILVIIAVMTAIFFLPFKQKPKVLTTNIDTVNKTINDANTDGDLDTVDGNFSSLINLLAENVSDSLRADATMLAAAANPSVKFVNVIPGMRKEEIAELVGQKLSWAETDKSQFLNINKTIKTGNAEGYYYPDTYLLPSKASGYEVGKLMINRFNDEVMSRYASSTEKKVGINTAMKIASIIEREAAGKNDMRLISGIMWNRIFKDMTLDIDATLQYAKGNEDDGWWKKVVSEDKFIDSPYNTYQNKGLTPTPISNPQLASIEAALNPKKTNCMFYLHDKYRRIHCSVTYKEHVKKIALYYGK
ncbi:MAG: endolytic transglycosylase MltG [Candidatus Paceibacterota bacterium]|jgi:UPF0755 protein